ncbi:MAG: PAS domain S-box protein [Deltaproteobacteria bacterium]|nr:PAS domain S-box protein [Deltaproteobacteria bacterium]
MKSSSIALIHPAAEVRADIGDMLRNSGYQVYDAAELDRASPLLGECATAVVDVWAQAPEDVALGDYVRSRLLPGGCALALLETESAEAMARYSSEKFDDFANVECGAIVMLARLEAALRARMLYRAADLRRRDAEILFELSQTLSSSLDVSNILHEATRLAARAFEVDRCAIVLLDAERGDGLVVAASENREIRDLQIRIDAYPELQNLLATSAPVIIGDATCSPVVDGVRELLAEKNVGAELLFPIVNERQVIGALFLRAARPLDAVDERQTRCGMTIASTVAIAIRNARLFDSFRDHSQRVNLMRLQAEHRMRSLEHYEDFFEYAADGMLVLDATGCVQYLNREGVRVLGRDREEIKGRPLFEMLTEREVLYAMLGAIRAGQHCRNVDVVLVRPTGELRSLSVSASPLGDNQGLALLSLRDITELQEMQTELKTTKDFLENLIDSSVDGIMAADLRGRILLFNKGAERIIGYRASEVIGVIPIWRLYPKNVATEIMAALRSEGLGGVGRLAKLRSQIIAKSGEAIPVDLTASVIYEDGVEVATVGIFSDLRERLEIEHNLEAAQKKLIETEKQAAIAELAGAAAHELNQPLTSVVGYSEMLRRKVKDTDPLRRPIDIIYREAERMAEIVRKIGQITRYRTKPYGGKAMIVDLKHAAAAAPSRPTPAATAPPADTPITTPTTDSGTRRQADGKPELTPTAIECPPGRERP